MLAVELVACSWRGCDRIQRLMVVETKWILASGSPRRRMLLKRYGLDFEIRPADVDERVLPGEAPEQYVRRLAEQKAWAAGVDPAEGVVVLAADTAVVLDGVILGKPRQRQEAEEMLLALRGRTHQVMTGVALFAPAEGRLLSEVACTDVPMRNYSRAEMAQYIASGDPMDKAGAYAIQHNGFRPVEQLSGCFANVVGLPLCHLTRLLRRFGFSPTVEVPSICRQAFDYRCSIYAQILGE